MPDTTQSNYEDLTALMRAAGADSSASEAHGMLCGTICAAGKTSPDLWLEYLLGEDNMLSAAANECSEMLMALQTELLRQFNDDAFGFMLFLPSDEIPLSQRTEALTQWCAGFLFGLALGGFRENVDVPENVAEVMRDLYEISRARFAYEQTEDADESAYVEIVEYVRMSGLLMYEELQPMPATRLQ